MVKLSCTALGVCVLCCAVLWEGSAVRVFVLFPFFGLFFAPPIGLFTTDERVALGLVCCNPDKLHCVERCDESPSFCLLPLSQDRVNRHLLSLLASGGPDYLTHLPLSRSEFCGAIARRIAQECSATVGFDEGWSAIKSKNAPSYYHTHRADLLKDNDIIITRPLGLTGDWKEVFDFPGHSYSIILMVRDPFEIIMSAYKYHSQVPAPEKWLVDKPYKVCSIAPYLAGIGRSLGKYMGNTTLFASWTEAIANDCRAAVSMFSPNATYLHQLQQAAALRHADHIPFDRPAADRYLQSIYKYEHNVTKYGLDLYPAVRLEAYRSLNEIVYMAASKLYEEPSMSLSMHLEEFGIGNLSLFQKGANKMMEFHMRHMNGHNRPGHLSANTNCPLCRCLNLQKAVALAVEGSFVPLSTPQPSFQPTSQPTSAPTTHLRSADGNISGNTTASHARRRLNKATHVTTNLMASSIKEMYKRRLALDPVLGPLLHLIADIVNAPTPQQCQHRMIDLAPPVPSNCSLYSPWELDDLKDGITPSSTPYRFVFASMSVAVFLFVAYLLCKRKRVR